MLTAGDVTLVAIDIGAIVLVLDDVGDQLDFILGPAVGVEVVDEAEDAVM